MLKKKIFLQNSTQYNWSANAIRRLIQIRFPSVLSIFVRKIIDICRVSENTEAEAFKNRHTK